jgi:hypothetical protein
MTSVQRMPANHATLNARYAVIITRHPTDSEQPAGAFDDGDQDAHTAPEPLPPEPAPPSTAVLRSVGGDLVTGVDQSIEQRFGDHRIREERIPVFGARLLVRISGLAAMARSETRS